MTTVTMLASDVRAAATRALQTPARTTAPATRAARLRLLYRMANYAVRLDRERRGALLPTPTLVLDAEDFALVYPAGVSVGDGV